MSTDADRIKRLVEFKKKLETKIENLTTELKDSQAMLETLDTLLLEKGFKRPEIQEEPTRTETPTTETTSETHIEQELDNITPLQTNTGELLAHMHVEEDRLRVVLADDKNFNFNTPPFNQFLLQKILLKMQERDNELARNGQLPPDKILCYNILREGDTIREIQIKNIDPERLKELKSSIRWTLEKMYEKTKTQT
ncbi:MAG: hypothetical protein ABSB89_09170 [Candidatus Bathyarchaeia archaeon]